MDRSAPSSGRPAGGQPPDRPRRLGFALRFAEGKALLLAKDLPVGDPGTTAADVSLDELALEVPNVRFPLDVTGGAERFQTRRLVVRKAALRASTGAIRALLQQGLVREGWSDLRVQLSAPQLELEAGLTRDGARRGRVLLRLAALPSPPSALDVVVTHAWVLGDAATTSLDAATAVLDALARGESAAGPLVRRLDVTRLAVRELLNSHGWKTPDFSSLREIQLVVETDGVRVVAASETPPTVEDALHQDRLARVLAASSLLVGWSAARGQMAQLRGLLDRVAVHPHALALVADLLMGDPLGREEALAALDEAISRHGETVDLLVARARLDRDDPKHWKRVLDWAQQQGDTALAHGAALAWAEGLPVERAEEALEAYRAASLARPDSGAVALGLAQVSVQAEQWAEAVRAARLAIQLGLSPVDEQVASRCLGLARMAMGDAPGGRRALLRALRHGEDTATLAALGQLSEADGKHGDAVRYRLRAAHAATDDVARAAEIAEAARLTHERLGDAVASVALWQQALALHRSTSWRAAAAKAAWAAGDAELTAQWALEDGGRAPESPELARLAGLALTRMGGREEETLLLLKRARTQDVTADVEVEEATALVRARMGDASGLLALEEKKARTAPAGPQRAEAIAALARQHLDDDALVVPATRLLLDAAQEEPTPARLDEAVAAIQALPVEDATGVIAQLWQESGVHHPVLTNPERARTLAGLWWTHNAQAARPLVTELRSRGALTATDWRAMAASARSQGVVDGEQLALEALAEDDTLNTDEALRLAEVLSSADETDAALKVLVPVALRDGGPAAERAAQLAEEVGQIDTALSVLTAAEQKAEGSAALAWARRARAAAALGERFEEAVAAARRAAALGTGDDADALEETLEVAGDLTALSDVLWERAKTELDVDRAVRAARLEMASGRAASGTVERLRESMEVGLVPNAALWRVLAEAAGSAHDGPTRGQALRATFDDETLPDRERLEAAESLVALELPSVDVAALDDELLASWPAHEPALARRTRREAHANPGAAADDALAVVDALAKRDAALVERLEWLRFAQENAALAEQSENEIKIIEQMLELARREPATAQQHGMDRRGLVLRLAALYEKAGNALEAVRVLSHAEALECPPAERALVFRRIALLEDQKLSRPDRALEALQHAFRADPDDDETVRLLMRTLDAQHRYRELATLHAQRAERGTGTARVAHLVAEGELWARKLGEPRRAVLCWRKALRLAPYSDAPLKHLQDLHRSRSPAAMVRTYLMAARLRGMPEAAPLLEEGGAMLAGLMDRPRMATVVFRAAASGSPPSSSALRALAEVYRALSRPEDAQAALRDLVAAAPDARSRAGARVARAEILAALHRWEDAWDELKAALGEQPQMVSALSLAVEATSRLGLVADYERLSRQRLLHVQDSHQVAEGAVAAGRELIRMMDLPAALRMARMAVEAEADNDDGWRLLLDASAQLSDAVSEAEALGTLSRIWESRDPEAAAGFLGRLAVLRLRSGKRDDAVMALRDALHRDPVAAAKALQSAWDAGLDVPSEIVVDAAEALRARSLSQAAFVLVGRAPDRRNPRLARLMLELGETTLSAEERADLQLLAVADMEAGEARASVLDEAAQFFWESGEKKRAIAAAEQAVQARATVERAGRAFVWAVSDRDWPVVERLAAQAPAESIADVGTELAAAGDLHLLPDVVLERWCEMHPTPMVALQERARRATQRGDADGVKRALTTILETARGTPEGDEAARKLATMSARAGDHEAAVTTSTAIHAPTAQDLLDRADWLSALERWDEELALVEKLLKRTAEVDESALCERAVELARDYLEEPARGVAPCRRWLELQPESRLARAALVELLEAAGNQADAAREVSAWAARQKGVEANALWRRATELARDSGDVSLYVSVAKRAHEVLQEPGSHAALTEALAGAGNVDAVAALAMERAETSGERAHWEEAARELQKIGQHDRAADAWLRAHPDLAPAPVEEEVRQALARAGRRAALADRVYNALDAHPTDVALRHRFLTLASRRQPERIVRAVLDLARLEPSANRSAQAALAALHVGRVADARMYSDEARGRGAPKAFLAQVSVALKPGTWRGARGGAVAPGWLDQGWLRGGVLPATVDVAARPAWVLRALERRATEEEQWTLAAAALSERVLRGEHFTEEDLGKRPWLGRPELVDTLQTLARYAPEAAEAACNLAQQSGPEALAAVARSWAESARSDAAAAQAWDRVAAACAELLDADGQRQALERAQARLATARRARELLQTAQASRDVDAQESLLRSLAQLEPRNAAHWHLERAHLLINLDQMGPAVEAIRAAGPEAELPASAWETVLRGAVLHHDEEVQLAALEALVNGPNEPLALAALHGKAGRWPQALKWTEVAAEEEASIDAVDWMRLEAAQASGDVAWSLRLLAGLAQRGSELARDQLLVLADGAEDAELALRCLTQADGGDVSSALARADAARRGEDVRGLAEALRDARARGVEPSAEALREEAEAWLDAEEDALAAEAALLLARQDANEWSWAQELANDVGGNTAITCADAWTQSQPADGRAWRARQKAHADVHGPAGEADVLEAWANASGDPAIMLEASDALRHAEENARSLKLLRRVAQCGQRALEDIARARLAERAATLGAQPGALDEILALISGAPSDLDLARRACAISEELGETAQAEAAWEVLARHGTGEEQARALMRVADIAHGRGDRSQERAWLRVLLRREPRSVQVHQRLAELEDGAQSLSHHAAVAALSEQRVEALRALRRRATELGADDWTAWAEGALVGAAKTLDVHSPLAEARARAEERTWGLAGAARSWAAAAERSPAAAEALVERAVSAANPEVHALQSALFRRGASGLAIGLWMQAEREWRRSTDADAAVDAWRAAEAYGLDVAPSPELAIVLSAASGNRAAREVVLARVVRDHAKPALRADAARALGVSASRPQDAARWWKTAYELGGRIEDARRAVEAMHRTGQLGGEAELVEKVGRSLGHAPDASARQWLMDVLHDLAAATDDLPLMTCVQAYRQPPRTPGEGDALGALERDAAEHGFPASALMGLVSAARASREHDRLIRYLETSLAHGEARPGPAHLELAELLSSPGTLNPTRALHHAEKACQLMPTDLTAARLRLRMGRTVRDPKRLCAALVHASHLSDAEDTIQLTLEAAEVMASQLDRPRDALALLRSLRVDDPTMAERVFDASMRYAQDAGDPAGVAGMLETRAAGESDPEAQLARVRQAAEAWVSAGEVQRAEQLLIKTARASQAACTFVVETAVGLRKPVFAVAALRARFTTANVEERRELTHAWLDRFSSLEEDKEPRAATRELVELVLAGDPDDIICQWWLAEDAQAEHRWEDAAEHWRALAELSTREEVPTHVAQSLHTAGVAALARSDVMEEAERLAAAQLEANPADRSALEIMLAAAMGRADAAQVASLLLRLASQTTSREEAAWVLREAADWLSGPLNDPAGAADALRSAGAFKPLSPSENERLTELARRAGDTDAELEALRKLTAEDGPQTGARFLRLAELLRDRARDPDEEITALHRALAFPDVAASAAARLAELASSETSLLPWLLEAAPPASSRTAAWSRALTRVAAAEGNAEVAGDAALWLAEHGESSEWAVAARWLAKTERSADSARAYQKAAENDETQRATFLTDAVAQWERANDLSAADGARLALLEHDPGNVATFEALERRFRRSGKLEQLAALARKVAMAQQDAGSRAGLLERAAILMRDGTGDESGALQAFSDSYAADTSRVSCALAVSDLLFRRGDLVEAGRWLERVPSEVDLSVVNISAAELAYRRGAAREAAGGDGREDFRHALELNRNHTVARDALVTACQRHGDPLGAAKALATDAHEPDPAVEPAAYARWILEQGRSLTNAGFPAASTSLLEEAFHRLPGSVELGSALVAATRDEEPARAAQVLMTLARTAPAGRRRATLFLDAVDAWRDAGRAADAARAAVAAHQETPADLSVLWEALSSAAAAEDDILIRDLVRELHALDRKPLLTPELHLSVARALRQDTKAEGATLLFHAERALEAGDDWQVRLLAVEGARRAPDPEALLRHVDAALPLAPDARMASALAAEAGRVALDLLKDNERAVNIVYRAHTLAPQDNTLKAMLAEAYSRDPLLADHALMASTHLLDADAELPGAFLWIARARAHQKDLRRAALSGEAHRLLGGKATLPETVPWHDPRRGADRALELAVDASWAAPEGYNHALASLYAQLSGAVHQLRTVTSVEARPLAADEARALVGDVRFARSMVGFTLPVVAASDPGAHIVGTTAPQLAVGPDVFTAPEAVRRAVLTLGFAAVNWGLEPALVMGVPDVTRLRQAVMAALGVGHENHPRLKAELQQLQRALRGRPLEAARNLAQDLVNLPVEMDAQWLAQSRTLLARLAFLAAGNLTHAMEALAVMEGGLAPSPQSAEALRLMRWVCLGDGVDGRRRLGLEEYR
ncbi:MAG: hypothetical protein AB2A00_21575 [Myxococcota bacterium]